jgi:hypothetical protein
LTIFCGAVAIEGVHPLQCGIGRRKVRNQPRHGLPRENPLAFYPRRGVEICVSAFRWGWLALTLRILRKRIEADPASLHYTDEALREMATIDEEDAAERSSVKWWLRRRTPSLVRR